MAEIIIPVAIDEQAKKDADAVFKRFDLTASQLCTLILTRLAADKFNNKEGVRPSPVEVCAGRPAADHPQRRDGRGARGGPTAS